MKHLKTFEGFSTENLDRQNVDEAFEFLKGKIGKAKDKFKNDNKDEFAKLKAAESALDQKNPETQKSLDGIQKSLMAKLDIFCQKELLGLLGISKIDADYTAVRTTLKNEIFEKLAYDTRTGFEKLKAGASSGIHQSAIKTERKPITPSSKVESVRFK